MKAIDKAWVAGIFEGEGSAGNWERYSKKDKHSRYARIAITNTDVSMLREVQKTTKGIISARIPRMNRINGFNERKISYCLTINKIEDINSFLKNIVPFIRSDYKKEQISKLNINKGSKRWRAYVRKKRSLIFIAK